MTQTLTTERQQFEEYFNDFYGCHPTDHHDPIHVEGIWHAWQDGNTRAANREAQPSITDEAIDRIVPPLSPDGLDEEKHHCEWNLYHDRERIRKELREYFTAPPAPLVPAETDLDSARMAVGFNRYIQAGYVDGWNACRAAMLAEAPEGGK